MKRTISFIIAVLMLCALCVPAFAEVFAGTTEIQSGSYNQIKITGTATINSDVTINSEGSLQMFGNSTLIIGSSGYLTGTDIYMSSSSVNAGQTIVLEEGGGLYITFQHEEQENSFADFLHDNNIYYFRSGNAIQAGACRHTDGECMACKQCGQPISGDTASALSEGNMTVVCTIAAAVVFGLGGFILGKKKKTSNS